jgi:hypothetical protein
MAADAATVASVTMSCNGSGTVFSLSTGGIHGSLSLCTFAPAGSGATQYTASCSASITPLESLVQSGNTAMGGSGTAIAAIPGSIASSTFVVVGDMDGGIFLCQVNASGNPLSCIAFEESLDHAVSDLQVDAVSQTLWLATDTGDLLFCPYLPASAAASNPSLGGCSTQISNARTDSTGILAYHNSTLLAQLQPQPQQQTRDLYFAAGNGEAGSTPAYGTGVYRYGSTSQAGHRCVPALAAAANDQGGQNGPHPYLLIAESSTCSSGKVGVFLEQIAVCLLAVALGDV